MFISSLKHIAGIASDVANEVAKIVTESSAPELIHSLMNPMTDSMVSYGVTATAITAATLTIDWHLQNKKIKSAKTAERRNIKKMCKPTREPEYALKGRVGQTIGRVRMKPGHSIDNFIADLESLNQLNRGRHTGPTVRFEIYRFQKPLQRHQGDFTHYSPFIGCLVFGDDTHEVKGLAKIQRQGNMIYSQVEFESDLGHFRLELPQIPSALASRDLKFMVDIGCPTKNLVG